MHARVSTATGKPENLDKVIEIFRDAMIGDEKGWRGGYVLVNRETGKIMTMTLWESSEALEQTASVARRIWEEVAGIAGADRPSVEAYEIVLQPEPAEIMGTR